MATPSSKARVLQSVSDLTNTTDVMELPTMAKTGGGLILPRSWGHTTLEKYEYWEYTTHPWDIYIQRYYRKGDNTIYGIQHRGVTGPFASARVVVPMAEALRHLEEFATALRLIYKGAK